MSFTVPSFNLSCDVYSGPWLTKAFRFNVMGNLAFGRRVQQQFQDDDVPEPQVSSLQMTLLLPPLTDLHDKWMGHENDVLEVPSGSGRWYGLECFDDVGKGFGNEYRIVILTKIGAAVDLTRYAGLVWPTPVP
jgi:hypothetical protein